MNPLMPFFRWLRSNSQKYLLEATQKDLAAGYGRGGPVGRATPQRLFFTYVFAPLYRRMSWETKHKIMGGMPGSHRKQWDLPPR